MRSSALLLLLFSHAFARPKSRIIRYPAWNTKMFPVWRDGDPRYLHSWKGGKVSFVVGNDSPTLTGAKVTFTIQLEFPHGQHLQPDGSVVWTEDGMLNGTQHVASEPVYPVNRAGWDAVFPDGTPIKKDQKPAYVFVWKTWGRYWQVSDGPCSTLTIDTDNIPLGSYTMDIVIYHYRSREKFIPLGYASNQFSITDQIPFAVSLDQVNDAAAADLSFVQNRAIAFTVALHDPSRYLETADITFNWDFGDASGALISRELTVTHTYVSSGSFRPQVVVQAVIPDKACDPPTPEPGPPGDQPTTAKVSALVSATPQQVSSIGLSDTEEDNGEGEVSSTAIHQLVQGTEENSQYLVNQVPGSGRSRRKFKEGNQNVEVRTVRSADDEDCVIYRYGSFSTGIQVFEGINEVRIERLDTSLLGPASRVLDVTVTCRGSVPGEVCSVMLDGACLKPVHTTCSKVETTSNCRAVIRHFFNHSGLYCINVSMSNHIDFASTSSKVKVDPGSGLLSSGPAILLLVVLLLAVAIIPYSYRRFKSHEPLKEDLSEDPGQVRVLQASGPSIFWSSLTRLGGVDNQPLLQNRLQE